MSKKNSYTTKGRTEILSILEENKDRGITVQEIRDLMEQEECLVNPTTVYRYLDKLCADGTVVKHIAAKGKKAMFQLAGTKQTCHTHLHIQCKQCGRVAHLECSFMKEIENHFLKHHGYTLDCSDSIIHGLCEQCRSVIG
ncbi:MAG: transcriptional repressor [Lachnospiraceae bacterium]|nr:transcriptional repressor [Lachnospiraceae bacterium]